MSKTKQNATNDWSISQPSPKDDKISLRIRNAIEAVIADDDEGGSRTYIVGALKEAIELSPKSAVIVEELSKVRPDLFWISNATVSKAGDTIALNGGTMRLPDVEARSAKLAPGLYAIIGKARSGKSRLAASMSANGIQHIEIGEPTATSMDRYSLSHVVFAALYERTDVVIDSVKYLITEGRNPGQYGVTAKFTEFLTALSVMAARRGIRIFVVVNPYMIPTSDMSGFIDRIESSTSGVIVPVNPDEWLIRFRDKRDSVHQFVNGDVDTETAVSGASVRSAFFLATADMIGEADNVSNNNDTPAVVVYDFAEVDADNKYVGVAAAAFNQSTGSWGFKNVGPATIAQKQTDNQQMSSN